MLFLQNMENLRSIVNNFMVIINGSMREDGVSGRIAQALCQEFSNVKYFSIRKMDIHFCMACERCKTASCFWKDDVNEVFQAWQEAQIIMILAPVYWGGVPAKLKALFDRAQGLCRFIEKEDGHWRIQSRLKKGKKILLGVSAGSCKLSETKATIDMLEAFFRHLGQKRIISAGFSGTDRQEDADLAVESALQFFRGYLK